MDVPEDEVPVTLEYSMYPGEDCRSTSHYHPLETMSKLGIKYSSYEKGIQGSSLYFKGCTGFLKYLPSYLTIIREVPMTFEEIFKEEGLYVADSFEKGVAFSIEKGPQGTELRRKVWKNADDIFPHTEGQEVYSGLFKKDYRKVFTRQQLFKVEP